MRCNVTVIYIHAFNISERLILIQILNSISFYRYISRQSVGLNRKFLQNFTNYIFSEIVTSKSERLTVEPNELKQVRLD